MTWLGILLGIVFVVGAPVAGCLIAGVDRIVSARMQGRQGPVLLQPYFDVRKLIEKDWRANDLAQLMLLCLGLLSTIIACFVFFSGGSFLLCVFLVTLSSLLYVLAASVVPSPFVQTGVQREILQVMCYEPMVLLVGVGLYLFSGSFDVAALGHGDVPMVVWQPLIFLGLLFVLTIKLHKSPFDIASSHHAHQEIVRGATTEMSGLSLAIIEVTHWYETVIFLGWVGMFFLTANPLSVLLALIVIAVVYFLEVWVDNTFARVKWQTMLAGSWIVAAAAGLVNFSLFYFVSSNGVVFF